MDQENTVSITIKGISIESKDNFSSFCATQGKSMQEVIRDFINGAYIFTENERQIMMISTVNDLIQKKPKLVDQFIIEREPLYQALDDDKKDSSRLAYAYINPTYIFSRYNQWLEEEEIQVID